MITFSTYFHVLPNFFRGLVEQRLVERIGWVLIHSLWQFALVAIVASVAVTTMQNTSARARYLLLLTVMMLSTWLPITTWFVQPTDPIDSSVRQVASGSFPVIDKSKDSSTDNFTSVPQGNMAGDVVEDQPWIESARKIIRPRLIWIVVVWTVGVVLCAVRPLLSWWTIRRLRRVGISRVSDEILVMMRQTSRRLGLLRTVQVFQSSLIHIPVVFGYFRPMILLPVALVTSLPVSQLEAILAHELAHVRRYDFLVNLLQTLIETLFFYHPVVWWLSHRLRVERELCCDDIVVSSLGNRIEYGRALVAIAELRGQGSLLAFGAADGSLRSRVRRIVGAPSSQTTQFPFDDRQTFVGLSLVCALAALLTTWTFAVASGKFTDEPGQVPNVIVDTETIAEQQTAPNEPDRKTKKDDLEFVVIPEDWKQQFVFEKRLVKVEGFDPKILAVKAMNPTTLQVEGRAVGVTLMIVTDSDGVEYSAPIDVIDPDSPLAERQRDAIKLKPRKNPLRPRNLETNKFFTLILFRGQERRLQSAQQVTRVDNFDTTIINVATPDAKSLNIKGLAFGKTSMKVGLQNREMDKFDTEFTIDVEVKKMTRELIRDLFLADAQAAAQE